MEKTMEADDKGVPIFVSTNADTHLVISSSPSDTVATLKGKIRSEHLFCFPHLGDIEIGALMVEHKSLVYHLPDSIFVETVFHGSNEMRYLLAEVFGSDLCNQRENKILSDKDENLGIVMKTEKAESHRRLDRISDGLSLQVDNIKSKKMKKHKLVTEGLIVSEGHNNNNERCTELVAAIDGKAVANNDFGKDVTNPDSGDNITYPMGGNKIKKRKKRHDLNEDLAGCSPSPCKEKRKGEQATTEIENIGHCSSEWMDKNIEIDKNSSLGQSTVSAKKSAGGSLNDNGTQNVSMAVEKCEQKILKGNTHTNAFKEHALGDKMGTERKHGTSKKLSTERICETSSKIFNEQNSLTETEKDSNGLQRKAVNTGKKIKLKKKRALKTVLEDDQGIFSNDVNDQCQITKHGHDKKYRNGKSEENSDKEFDMVKMSKHEKKIVSQHGLGDVDHALSSQYVDDEHQKTDYTSSLEYKSSKQEEVVAKCPVASKASDKNGLTNNIDIGAVKYLDVSNNTENLQPCTMTKKKKTKHSRHDMTKVDVQEKITTEKIHKNNITVNSSKDDRDVSTLDTVNKNRRNIPSENGSVGYLNTHNSKNNASGDLEHNTEAMQIPSLMEKGCYNEKEVKLSKKIPSKVNRDRTTKAVEKGMDELVAGGSRLEQNGGDLEHVPETLETAPNQKCKDKEIKSSNNSSSKACQETTFNIEKRGIEEGVLKSPPAPFVSDKNGQTNYDMSGSVKYLDISNNIENHEPLNITRKKKMRHSKNHMTLVDAQERITTEKVKNDEMIVNSSKSERDASILSAGNEDRIDTPCENGTCENGTVKYLDASHSKRNRAKYLEHFTKTMGTASMVDDEGCNTETLKSLQNSPSKINQDSTTKAVERGTDEVVTKGGNFKQSTRSKEKKQKDSGLKSKSSAVHEDSNANLSLKDKHAKNAVVKTHHSVDKNLVQRREGSADVDCKAKKTTISQIDTNNTNHSLKPDEDIGIQDLKFQSTAEDFFQKSAQNGKLDTNYVKKSSKENHGDAHFTEKIQPENNDAASQKYIGESCGPNLKRKEGSSAGKTQSSEKNEDINRVAINDRSQGADGCYERKDNSVIRHSQKKIATDAYADSQCTEECGIDCNSSKLQLVGRTQDGEVMNRARGMDTISREIKTVKKTKVDNVSKKNHISLFRGSSDESTEGNDGIDAYKGSSSSEGSASDSPHSYDSDGGSSDNISKIQSMKLKTAMEPSANAAQLSTEDGKKKDNGGNGYIHSKFVHILAKKTGLGELFKIARSHQKPESEHFGGDFMADDSPTVDMVLETQESQVDPVLYASHDRELTASIRADEAKEDGKTLNAEVPKANSALKLDAEAQKTNFMLKSHPTHKKKVSWKSDSPSPINNSAQLKMPRKTSNR